VVENMNKIESKINRATSVEIGIASPEVIKA
jgi:hypothetical protein